MNLDVNGNAYVVKFYYYDTLTCAENMAIRRHTTCTIEGPDFSASGTVVCNPKEPYVKVAARWYALEKTLQDCDREFRAAIWKAYLGKIEADKKRGVMEYWGKIAEEVYVQGFEDARSEGAHEVSRST